MGLDNLIKAYREGKRQRNDEKLFYASGIGFAFLALYRMDIGALERRNRDREEIFNRLKPTRTLQRAAYNLGYYLG